MRHPDRSLTEIRAPGSARAARPPSIAGLFRANKCIFDTSSLETFGVKVTTPPNRSPTRNRQSSPPEIFVDLVSGIHLALEFAFVSNARRVQRVGREIQPARIVKILYLAFVFRFIFAVLLLEGYGYQYKARYPVLYERIIYKQDSLSKQVKEDAVVGTET